jgi:AcrR family transcriptional regulator
MSPRRYRAPQRRAAAEATRRRIVDAVIALHAEQGVTRTTYAQIAARADVAIPTVYNHFPALSDLLAACSGEVLAAAPPLGPEILAAADDLDGRLAALARAFCAFYRYAAPWLRWSVHEAALVREIAERLAGMAERRCRLIELALEPAFGRRPPPPLSALCDILLDFPAWQRLARTEDDAGRQAAVLARGLLAVARDHLPAAAWTRAARDATTRHGRSE